MPLHTNHRPDTFDDFFGNDELVSSLKSVLIDREDPRQVFVFAGIPGSGKTTLARIIKEVIGCSDLDYYEYDAARTRSIDFVRRTIEKIPYAALDGDVKMIVLDESHELPKASQDALLKTLEEPPKHVYFCLCTTDPQKLLPAIKRRGQIATLNPLNMDRMRNFLNSILEKEEMDHTEWEVIVKKIISCSNGSAGVALSLLDSVIDMDGEDEDLLKVIEGATHSEMMVNEICQILLNRNIVDKWAKIRPGLAAFSGDVESTRIAILTYMSEVILGETPNPYASTIGAFFVDSFMYSGKGALVLALEECCSVLKQM